MKRPIAVKIVVASLWVVAVGAVAIAVFLKSKMVSKMVLEADDVAAVTSGLWIASLLFLGVAVWFASLAVLVWKRFRAGWVLALLTFVAGIVLTFEDVRIFGLFSEDGLLIFVPIALTMALLLPSVLRWFFRQRVAPVETAVAASH